MALPEGCAGHPFTMRKVDEWEKALTRCQKPSSLKRSQTQTTASVIDDKFFVSFLNLHRTVSSSYPNT